MKAITLTKITATSILALALTGGALQVLAAGTAKGGAQLLVAQPAATAATASVPKPMVCAECKDVAGVRESNLGKGAFVKTEKYATHACPGCSTKVTTVGVGKAKTDTVTHECATAPQACHGM